MYLSPGLKLRGVTSKPVLSEVLWVTAGALFPSSLFFSYFKFLDVDSVPWNVNVVSSTIHVNKTSQTAFIWFALSCHVHDKISYHVSYQMNTYRKIIEWLELEGTLRLSPNPPAMTRDIFQEIRLPEAPSNPALNTSRNGVHLTNLIVKNF